MFIRICRNTKQKATAVQIIVFELQIDRSFTRNTKAVQLPRWRGERCLTLRPGPTECTFLEDYPKGFRLKCSFLR